MVRQSDTGRRPRPLVRSARLFHAEETESSLLLCEAAFCSLAFASGLALVGYGSWQLLSPLPRRRAAGADGAAGVCAAGGPHELVHRFELRGFLPQQRFGGACSWQRTACAPRRTPRTNGSLCWTELPESSLPEAPRTRGDHKCSRRYKTLREAMQACAVHPRCGGVTRDNGVACSARSAFESGGLDGGALCIAEGALSKYSAAEEEVWRIGGESSTPTLVDFGGRHFYTIRRRRAPWPPGAVWHDHPLLLTWFTCEGNINHFLGETVGPIWRLLRAINSTSRQLAPSHASAHGVRLPQVAIAGVRDEHWFTRPHSDQNCKGSRWAPILALLPIQRELLFVPHQAPSSSRAPRRVTVRAFGLENGSSRDVPSERPLCFRQSYQQVPAVAGAADNSQSFYRDLAKLGGCPPPTTRNRERVRIILIRRSRSRRIVNEEELLARLDSSGVSVEAVDLSLLNLTQQITMVCRARLLVGVHGAGMEWAHFLNSGLVSMQGTTLAGSIELHYPGWPCYYTSMMKDAGLAAECQLHSRANAKHKPKDDDVLVNIPLLLHGLRKMIAQLTV
ncbi:hypothetical protein AB1Y20_016884 [Prymnesium parvum]|uniref:Glycosyltransferase 61 catalytic domain-containing protein n=1 Tax=Prymnesium parvum TaxID=97485 RepID=A0AB34I9F4_PRYPA